MTYSFPNMVVTTWGKTEDGKQIWRARTARDCVAHFTTDDRYPPIGELYDLAIVAFLAQLLP